MSMKNSITQQVTKEHEVSKEEFIKEYKISEDEFQEIQKACDDFFNSKKDTVKYYLTKEDMCGKIVYTFDNEDYAQMTEFIINNQKTEYQKLLVCLGLYESVDKKNDLGCCVDYSKTYPGLLNQEEDIEGACFRSYVYINGVNIYFSYDECQTKYAKEHAQYLVCTAEHLFKNIDFSDCIPKINQIKSVKQEKLSDECYEKIKGHHLQYPLEKAALGALIGKRIGNTWTEIKSVHSELTMYKSAKVDGLSRELCFDVDVNACEGDYELKSINMKSYSAGYYMAEDSKRFEVEAIWNWMKEKYEIHMIFADYGAEIMYFIEEKEMDNVIAIADEVLRRMIAYNFDIIENQLLEYTDEIEVFEDED